MSWIVPALLGTYHGLNPAMGWLFAVALGLQERRGGAVLRALPPIALGHAASVGVVVATATGASLVVPPAPLRAAAAFLLFGSAVLLLVRPVHPRRAGGMRLGARGLAFWSFVAATAHGAGLMLLPVVMHDHSVEGHGHATATAVGGAVALAVHTAAMFGAMTLAALLAFHVLGVAFLRRAWLNTELVWSGALAASGLVLLLVR